MTSRQVNRKFTPNRWNFGSWPEIAGAMYRPVASHAVAIQSTRELQVPGARHGVGQVLGERDAVEALALDARSAR